MRVGIIGDGGWGTALALVAHGNGHEVRAWGPFADYIDDILRHGENRKFLKGVALPKEITWTASREEAVDGSEVVIFAVPSRYFKGVAESFASLVPSSSMVLSVAKGLDQDSHQRMTEVAQSALGRGPVAALSGPNHAEEVARGAPSASVVACSDHDLAVHLQSLLSSATFRVYTSDDVIGVELGGALKNVMALAAGISDGIGFGDNSKAALVTRGLAEMTRMGIALGAHPATFSGLSGMGDLIVTCASTLSRNRGVGERLGRGETIEQILESMEQVAEGVWTCTAARALARELGIDVPITDEVHAVIHEGKNPRDAVESLLTRDPRPERD